MADLIDFAAAAAQRGQELATDGRGGITTRPMRGDARSREQTAVIHLHQHMRRSGTPGWLRARAEEAARQAARDGADSYDALHQGLAVIADHDERGPGAA
ncbi:hypothetical protein [Halorhodospira halophila]|uniref:hypothetical protein n=1 Tax=Halorhodospira halophila TaxID=1053 RepID=UPI0019137E55|nr:hypothetical protein [Halorhodospira halophila]MBK5942745.1 hypothetical protein [Halorhodospira halophila]